MKLLMISGFAAATLLAAANHHVAVALVFDQPSCRDRRHDVAASRGRRKQASERGV